ncbi:adenosylcobinamide-phosphate synthase [Maritimibacter alkaliphilus HTCC2654]|uniref:Cobalamin biosynthesis protein CobD n=1 Tax=Maritimibacter alkaliphilus HTCC2654 TaxID=314271 RepID=A3VFH7_9RHOB|nr:adenosylcobinamide-phosphate synthase CbiB [Maritimibacter alkaliphilus]EAQ13092.1 cobalamin biosynthesis protein CobD [Rhodobacterales bacterium HTCC2654] [Maritimibacter alkaliphilus HTCC2654]TYP78814.1 adenosylcobinamide-phosphate synthase [Maritimibacter alkaliphilus HTCC2654]
MSFAAVLILALLIDAVAGEPEEIWGRVPHPAVLMGRAVGWCDDKLNAGKGRLMTGAVTIAALASLAATLGWMLGQIGWLVEALVAAILLAHRSLVDHVEAVADALTRSLGDGKRAVAQIVGRDITDMDDADVARAAIESGAENFSDGVVAPAFWFLVAGLPGLLAYKMVNTADSMIGYRTPRHEQFGKAAARLDDVLNWIPARISAGLIFLINHRPGGWATIAADAPLHRSPNAGWPEAAMAVSLDVALSGPRSYEGERRDFPFVNEHGERDIGAPEIDRAVSVLWRAWVALLVLVFIIAVVW